MAKKRQPASNTLPAGLECGCMVSLLDDETQGQLLSDEVTNGNVLVQVGQEMVEVPVESVRPAPSKVEVAPLSEGKAVKVDLSKYRPKGEKLATKGVITTPQELMDTIQKVAESVVTGNAAGLRKVIDKWPGNETDEQISEALPPTTVSSQKGGLAGKLKGKLEKEEAKVKAHDEPHLMIEARAGTGKTTTLIEGLKLVTGKGESQFVASEEQAVIWEQMARSRGKAKSICFLAFNNSIATELERRVPKGVDAMTTHRFGNRAVSKAFDLRGESAINKWRVDNIMEELLGLGNIKDVRKSHHVLISATKKLTDLVKMNLVPLDVEDRDDQLKCDELLLDLADYYDVELQEEYGKDWTREVLDLVPRVITRCKDVDKDRCIDFADMIWLPTILGLPMKVYDLLLVDEVQDLNRAQQSLVRKCGHRLIMVGDSRQSIYSFAGADSKSMDRMFDEMSHTPRGCIKLPLTYTRRCGKAIVAEANKQVPDFHAFPDAPEGKVSFAKFEADSVVAETYTHLVVDGDMVLCRVNAPLVSQCFRFIRIGRRANIQGRDIGEGLISQIKKFDRVMTMELISDVSTWMYREMANENAKRNPSDEKLIAIQDKADCIMALCENTLRVEEVIQRVRDIFTDEGQEQKRPGIRLSSIHRAKGLEAKRVFFLQPKGAKCPHPLARSEWQVEGERCLWYVAVTRAREELIHVS